ncbi:A disintegrin and metalloproteinase with thrombospondin motifs gon-1-like isoform X1 [Venturia canescens]|uniref:A disintegrin and metalloproteinase with thrombospondin motifs gon-1-like isoform X1 n=1 Tax=Venturia canescens TaxID=32260 RepID=UPI001C9C2EB4|nr:A disintegrin and metalloproteinase with thrombospondin motifs gon-1-like isoform X1 [Venturia canescens]
MYLAEIVLLFLAAVDPCLCNEKVPDANDDAYYENIGKRPETSSAVALIQLIKDQRVQSLLNPGGGALFTTSTLVYYGRPNAAKIGGVQYDLSTDAMNKVARVLQDPVELASLVIQQKRNHQKTASVRSKRADTNNPVDDGSMQDESHEYSQFAQKTSNTSDTLRIEAVSDVHRNAKRDTEYKNHDTLHARLLIELDSNFYHNETERELIRTLKYVMAFWNAVELSFRSNLRPSINFYVVAIVLATTPEATPHLLNSRIPNSEQLDNEQSVENTEDHWFKAKDQIPMDTYDIAVTMTKRILGEDSLGVARIGSVCGSSLKKDSKPAVAIFTDNADFTGIHAGIHELGHVFGLTHESNEKCRIFQTGYIMDASSTPTEFSSKFSICSYDQLSSRWREGKFACLYRAPETTSAMPHLVPGKMMSLEQQCQGQKHKEACSYGLDEICVRLRCLNERVETEWGTSESCKRLSYSAALGTPCGSQNDGKQRFCYMNRCIEFDN